MFIYVWPKKSIPLQITALFCFTLLIAGRFLNLLVPIYNKYIVGKLHARIELTITFIGLKADP